MLYIFPSKFTKCILIEVIHIYAVIYVVEVEPINTKDSEQEYIS